MSEFLLQPQVYTTGKRKNLSSLLEKVWITDFNPGEGEIFILSGFGNYNGGVRFYSTFKRHVDSGGKVTCFFGGSTSQRLTSKQIVSRMINCGCEVNVINRKRLFHSKCYGTSNEKNQSLIVTSGNFTGPGMSQNVESAVYLDNVLTRSIGFEWEKLSRSIKDQNWEIYQPKLDDAEDPSWTLLYDEYEEALVLDDTQFVTMVVTLGHSDTARINAASGTDAAKGSQYFWLSKDCYDFFPPLTILNERGYKTTNSCLINLFYVDLNLLVKNSRVTFEAGNNVDFRLGTGKYRYTGSAAAGDLAAISRISEFDYEIRIYRHGTEEYQSLLPYATTFIGHRDKRIGYLSNKKFMELTDVSLLTKKDFQKMIG